MFVLFLYKNSLTDIEPMTLAVLVLLVSRSSAEEKALMVGLIANIM